jgi:hypothetical protein
MKKINFSIGTDMIFLKSSLFMPEWMPHLISDLLMLQYNHYHHNYNAAKI